MTQTSFVSAMAAAVSGVHVVTTDGAAGRLGLTVRRAIATNRAFAVNALGARQAAVADTFPGRPVPLRAARRQTLSLR